MSTRGSDAELTLTLTQWLRQKRGQGPSFSVEHLEACLKEGIRRRQSRVFLGREGGMNCYLETGEGRVYA